MLFLKTLLSQHGLDTPFTGGLGSYKLYVLVAHHIERHLSLGGSDRPGEIILSFLFRFGMSGVAQLGTKRNDQRHCTKLKQYVALDGPNGGCADLSNVFRLDECIELFRLCWERLWSKIVLVGRQPQSGGRTLSLLDDLVCTDRLDRERKLARKQLQATVGRLRGQLRSSQSTTVANATTTAPTMPKKPSGNNKNNKASSTSPRGDLTANEIVAGYGLTPR